MISIVLAVCIVSIFEIRALKREGDNRGLAVFIGLAVITLALGTFYFSKSSEDSLADLFFHIINISY